MSRKKPFFERPLPSLNHPNKRVRKRRAAYMRRVARRVEIEWAGHHRAYELRHPTWWIDRPFVEAMHEGRK